MELAKISTDADCCIQCGSLVLDDRIRYPRSLHNILHVNTTVTHPTRTIAPGAIHDEAAFGTLLPGCTLLADTHTTLVSGDGVSFPDSFGHTINTTGVTSSTI